MHRAKWSTAKQNRVMLFPSSHFRMFCLIIAAIAATAVKAAIVAIAAIAIAAIVAGLYVRTRMIWSHHPSE